MDAPSHLISYSAHIANSSTTAQKRATNSTRSRPAGVTGTRRLRAPVGWSLGGGLRVTRGVYLRCAARIDLSGLSFFWGRPAGLFTEWRAFRIRRRARRSATHNTSLLVLSSSRIIYLVAPPGCASVDKPLSCSSVSRDSCTTSSSRIDINTALLRSMFKILVYSPSDATR